MMLRTALLSLLATAVAAKSFTPSGDVKLNSPLGRKMMEAAQVVEPARALANNNNNGFYDLYNYSLRYIGCSSLVQIAAEQEQNNENGAFNGLYIQHLVKFSICPSASCSSSACSGGGEYVMNMAEFVDAYTENKLNEQELLCENLRESCYCDDANDDQVCEETCYTNAGHTECINYDGEENFEIQRYLECQEMKGQNNNNNNGVAYFIGPYCSPKDGKSIFMGVFSDEACTKLDDASIYASQNYGAELPFVSASIVGHDCVSCKQEDQNNDNNNGNNNNNQNQNIEAKEFCTETYQGAAKCEEKMEKQYNKDTSGCDYINNILPKLDSASRSIATGKSSMTASSGKSGKAAKAFAGIFAFTTVLFAAYAYFLYRKIKRGSVNLSSQ